MRVIGLSVLVVGVVAAGCPGTRKTPPESVGPPIPTNFTPPPPLGPEPPVAPDLLGRDWLEAVHAGFHERWADLFLEQARAYLPPTDPLNDMSLAVTLEVVVADDGAVRAVEVRASSGNPQFDDAARQVVLDSAPLPRPPADLRSDDGLFYLAWLFARDARQDGVANARVERREWEPERAIPALLQSGRLDEALRRLGRAAEAVPRPSGEQGRSLIGLSRDVAAAALGAAIADDGSDSALRVEAVRGGGRTRVAALAPRLRELARGEADANLQRAALEALGDLGDRDALPILAEVVGRLDGERSAAAAAAMAKLGEAKAAWEAVAPALRGDGRARAAALATLADVGAPDSAAALAGILGHKGAPRPDRVAAARALGAVAALDSAPARKALGNALADGDAAVRAAAADGLARAGQAGYRSKGVFYKVLPLLKDKDPRVRAAALVAAAAVEPKEALPELVIVARKEKDPVVLAACARALGLIGGVDAVAALKKLAQGGAPEVRIAALETLAAGADADGRAAVAALAGDESPAVRVLAARVATDGAALDAALADVSPEVRAAALASLVRIRGSVPTLARLAELFVSAESVRERVLFSLAWLGATA